MNVSFITKFAILVFMVAVPTAWGQTWKSGATTVTLKDETLTVSGKGAMKDYCFECDPPWYESRDSITNLIIEVGVTSIGETTFAGCSNLTSVTISNSVTVIRDNAFAYCGSLNSITIPNSVTSIGWGAFSDCKSLTSITIPSGVTKIDELAFFGTSNLASINVATNNTKYSSEDDVLFNKNKTHLIKYPDGKKGAYIIPKSVTKLGDYAFKYSPGLTSITSLNPVPPSAGEETLLSSEGISACLYVPESSIAAYRAAKHWYFKCIKGIETAPEPE